MSKNKTSVPMGNASVKLPKDTIEELRRTANEMGCSKSDVMRYRIEHPQNGVTPASVAIFQNLINSFPENRNMEQQKRVDEAQMEVNRLCQNL